MSVIGKRRRRLLWTLLAVVIGVSILPLLVSGYFLQDISRDSLETLEKKYLTRSAVSISKDIAYLVSSYTQQLAKIAGGLENSSAMVPGTDVFTAPSQNALIKTYTSSDPDLLALRLVNREGVGAYGEPSGLSGV